MVTGMSEMDYNVKLKKSGILTLDTTTLYKNLKSLSGQMKCICESKIVRTVIISKNRNFKSNCSICESLYLIRVY